MYSYELSLVFIARAYLEWRVTATAKGWGDGLASKVHRVLAGDWGQIDHSILPCANQRKEMVNMSEMGCGEGGKLGP